MFDVDVDKAKVVVAESALALGGPIGDGLWPAIQAFGLENAPDAVAIEMRQEVADDEGEVVEREVGGASKGADDGALSLRRPGQCPRPSVAFQGRWCGRAERSRQSAAPRLRHLRTVSALTP